MNAPVAALPAPRWRRSLGSLVCVACAASVMLFLWSVAQFYQPGTGFSSLIAIGDQANPPVTELRETPHYVYENSAGYDSTYYVQLALNPTLRNPELKKAIDNPQYRARRMLFSWVAWAAGLGQPTWIVQAHALLNVVCWLVLAGVLFRWFPPTSWENFLRWFGVMFSHGVCMSVHDSLVDGPSLLLVAIALAWVEDGRQVRGMAMLALAGLGKETSLLAVTGLADGGWRSMRTWVRFALTAGLVALPLAVWFGYVHWRFPSAGDAGLNNFTLPFAGLAEKWGAVLGDMVTHPYSSTYRAAAAALVAATVQLGFFMLWRRPGEIWWRVGASFAVLMVFLSTPVWEGYPGAFTRVLLPMTLAFNVLVPRGRVWLVVLIAGNLNVLAGLKEFSPPGRDFFQLTGEPKAVAAVQVARTTGWYGVEEYAGLRWRWSAGDAVLGLRNGSGRPLQVIIRGRAASALDRRQLVIRAAGVQVWSGTLADQVVPFQCGFVAPAGESLISFTTDQAPHAVGADTRRMAFKVFNLEVVVQPMTGQR